jgi:hypothetical protein
LPALQRDGAAAGLSLRAAKENQIQAIEITGWSPIFFAGIMLTAALIAWA